MSQSLLLADDSVTIRRVIELTFADEQVDVVSVNSGREALDRIASDAESRPSIVLADIGMSDVNGYDIAAFVKGRADLRHIPVVLLAGAFEPLDETRARQVGSDAVLIKPFEPQMVVARVRELLARPPQTLAAPAVAQTPAAPAVAQTPAPPAVAQAPVPPPARIAPPAAPSAPPQASRAVSPDTPEPVRAAGRSTAADPIFNDSLDRLDAGFGDTNGPALAAEVADDFAQDLKELRAGHPGARTPEVAEPAFARDDFGDWDLPSRATPHVTSSDDFEGIVAEPPRSIAPAPTPAPTPAMSHAPAPVPASPPAPLPPPVTLQPRTEPARAAAPRPAMPAAAPLADAFSNLLAAEEGRPHQPISAPVFSPASDSVPSPVANIANTSQGQPGQARVAGVAAGGEISDETLDQIVDKVVARLGAGVRGSVLDLAERLVRAEIDRLKTLR